MAPAEKAFRRLPPCQQAGAATCSRIRGRIPGTNPRGGRQCGVPGAGEESGAVLGGVVGGTVGGVPVVGAAEAVGPVLGPPPPVPEAPPTGAPAEPPTGEPTVGVGPGVGCTPVPLSPTPGEGDPAPRSALGLGSAVDVGSDASRCRPPARPAPRPSWDLVVELGPPSTGVPADAGVPAPATSMHPVNAPVAMTPTTTAATARPTPTSNLPTARGPASRSDNGCRSRRPPCPSNGGGPGKDTAVQVYPAARRTPGGRLSRSRGRAAGPRRCRSGGRPRAPRSPRPRPPPPRGPRTSAGSGCGRW